MGVQGNDTLEYYSNGINSPPLAEGSYFDGGLGLDTLKGSAVADHFWMEYFRL